MPSKARDLRSWVRAVQAKPSAKLVLYALHARADRKGQCWPSIETLQHDTGLSRRTIHSALSELKHDGHISIKPRSSGHGRGRSSNLYELIYRVQQPHLVVDLQSATAARGGCNSRTLPRATAAPRSKKFKNTKKDARTRAPSTELAPDAPADKPRPASEYLNEMYELLGQPRKKPHKGEHHEPQR